MKLINKFFLLSGVLLAGLTIASCSDADEYEDTNTNNPTFVKDYTDTTVVAHPESLAGTSWTRGASIKKNAYGHEVQGYVESLTFDEDSVVVKMSEPSTLSQLSSDETDSYVWKDESNNAKTPKYEYVYAQNTGRVEIVKMTKDDKGKVSKTTIFMGIVNSGAQDIMTMSHFGDTPSQTYLIRQ